MGKIWLLILLSSVGTLLFANPSAAVAAMVKGSHDAVRLAMELVALYAFWLGFFSVLERTGIANRLAKILRPAVRFLFPGSGADTQKFITLNMSANILGLGNASTPMAVRAVNSMSGDGGRASLNMIMLVVISSTSLQLLPSTVIGMRATHGSVNPSDFLIPCMIATALSTVLGITMVKLSGLFRRRKKRSKTADAPPLTPNGRAAKANSSPLPPQPRTSARAKAANSSPLPPQPRTSARAKAANSSPLPPQPRTSATASGDGRRKSGGGL